MNTTDNRLSLSKPFKSMIMMFLAIVIISSGCNRALTQEDVEVKIEKARNATKEAEERTKEAIAAREKFYDDYKDQQLDALNDRIKEIDKKIRTLDKTAKDAGNGSAASSMKSAILSLEAEKEDLKYQINRVNSLSRQDWSASYENINSAVSQVEEEISRLEISLESMR